jgi:hypothetical protein
VQGGQSRQLGLGQWDGGGSENTHPSIIVSSRPVLLGPRRAGRAIHSGGLLATPWIHYEYLDAYFALVLLFRQVIRRSLAHHPEEQM